MVFRRRVQEINECPCISLPLKRLRVAGVIKIVISNIIKPDGKEYPIHIDFLSKVGRSRFIFIPKWIAEYYDIEKGDIVEVEVAKPDNG